MGQTDAVRVSIGVKFKAHLRGGSDESGEGKSR
jgi:hypothetical protein